MKKIKKYIIVVGIILAIILVGLAIYFGLPSVSGNVIAPISGKVVATHGNYTWTKAICNSRGCIDVVIECQDGKVKSMEPASDIVRMDNITDTRENGDVFCE